MSAVEPDPQPPEQAPEPDGISDVPTAGATDHMPLWLLIGAVVAVVAVALAALAVLSGGTLPQRSGPPVEELTVERTVLTPGAIGLLIRNTGPDPVSVAQVSVNDSYVDFVGPREPLDRLQTAQLELSYPWVTGQPYTVSLMTSTGLVVEHAVDAAVATPAPDPAFFGLMTVLGVYVGVLPVLLGMLVLPVIRRTGSHVVRVLLAVAVGLLAYLAVDATVEGIELGAASGGAFGGPLLVPVGAGLAFLGLTAVDRLLARRRPGSAGSSGLRLATMIAIGIGLHNLGEGLVIGSAYAVGELALGATLVVGFALHNTTEGLAVVTPLTGQRPSPITLAGLGLLAGSPAILGAIIGGSIANSALTALLFGVGVGAIVQVIVQIAPGLRDRDGGRALDPAVIAGITGGVLVMFLTGLTITA